MNWRCGDETCRKIKFLVEKRSKVKLFCGISLADPHKILSKKCFRKSVSWIPCPYPWPVCPSAGEKSADHVMVRLMLTVSTGWRQRPEAFPNPSREENTNKVPVLKLETSLKWRSLQREQYLPRSKKKQKRNARRKGRGTQAARNWEKRRQKIFPWGKSLILQVVHTYRDASKIFEFRWSKSKQTCLHRGSWRLEASVCITFGQAVRILLLVGVSHGTN